MSKYELDYTVNNDKVRRGISALAEYAKCGDKDTGREAMATLLARILTDSGEFDSVEAEGCEIVLCLGEGVTVFVDVSYFATSNEQQ